MTADVLGSKIMSARRVPTTPTPLLSRRQALAGALCLCCLPARARAASPGPFATEEVAPGIHIRRGVHEEATPENRDAIANVGFIVGGEAVLVADPGGCLADGRSLRATIREKTPLPIRYVAMSHVHPDHIFGAGAFQLDDPAFVGHVRLPDALAQRGDYYRERLEEVLGAGQAGPVVMPTMAVEGTVEIDLGGRVIALTAHAAAHTDNDLSLLDRNTGTLLPADLLFVDRTPSLDGSLRGWLKELEALKTVGATRAVPGHGPAGVDWPGASADLERYLTALLDETRAAVAANIGIDAAVETVAASERDKWALFDEYNGHNVTKAYKELEWE
jgi:quinoprotein relay system zinc metallohydrolase 2